MRKKWSLVGREVRKPRLKRDQTGQVHLPGNSRVRHEIPGNHYAPDYVRYRLAIHKRHKPHYALNPNVRRHEILLLLETTIAGMRIANLLKP